MISPPLPVLTGLKSCSVCLGRSRTFGFMTRALFVYYGNTWVLAHDFTWLVAYASTLSYVTPTVIRLYDKALAYMTFSSAALAYMTK